MAAKTRAIQGDIGHFAVHYKYIENINCIILYVSTWDINISVVMSKTYIYKGNVAYEITRTLIAMDNDKRFK